MSTALQDGRPQVSGNWIASFGLMYLGINIAWAAPSQLLIANQILGWYPQDKEAKLAFIMALGGFVSLVAGPVLGILSDKTRSRFGRRAPWIVAGSVLAAGTLVAMAFTPTYTLLVAGWAFFQLVIAAAVTASQAVPPDRVPGGQYGLVSGVMGISWTLAVVVGTLVGESLSLVTAYIVTAVLVLALICPYLMFHNRASLETMAALEAGAGASGKGSAGADEAGAGEAGAGEDSFEELIESKNRAAILEAELAGGFQESGSAATRPIAPYWDFSWVFISRLVATLGNNVALFYLLYYLHDHIGMEDPDAGVLILTAVYAGVVVAVSILAGKASDALGRRKPFVALSCLGIAGACFMMAFAHTFPVVVVAAVILGISWGTFTAVDQAMINQSLPNAETRGRDIGYMTIAVAVPNLASPLLAAYALLVLGGYPGLYVLAAVLAIVGALSILAVRGSR